MYYEEKIENGILYYRHLPDGEWHKADYAFLMQKIMALEGERSRLHAEIELLRADAKRLQVLSQIREYKFCWDCVHSDLTYEDEPCRTCSKTVNKEDWIMKQSEEK